MFGAQLILILVIMGGAIAFLGDKLGSKIGKKRLTIFGLRPHYTSILMTIITGVVVAGATMGILMISSTSVRTALFGMEKIRTEIATLNKDKTDILRELDVQKVKVADLDKQIKQSFSFPRFFSSVIFSSFCNIVLSKKLYSQYCIPES